MSVYIVCEPEFKGSTWCSEITRGIVEASKKKRLDIVFYDECENNSLPSSHDMIAVCATNPYWISNCILHLKEKTEAHIVLVGNAPMDIEVSNVCIDVGLATRSVISHLRNDCGKKSLALYGVNPTSVNDLAKLSVFSGQGATYLNKGDLLTCYEEFSNDVDFFDGVICTNDYAAVSLINQLKAEHREVLDRLYIISFADTALASQGSPTISSVNMDFFQCGKNAVEVFGHLKGSDSLSCINVSIKSKIIPRETTFNVPFSCNREYISVGRRRR